MRTSYLSRLTAITLTLVFAVSFSVPLTSVRAASVDDLQAKKDALEKQAQQLQAQAQQKKTVAEQAAIKIQQTSVEIEQITGSIQDTNQRITDTQSQIDQKNQDVANLESQLRRINDQQSALVRQLYIMSKSLPDDLAFFSDQSVSKRDEQENQFSALKKSVAALYARTSEAKLAVEKSRDDLQRQNQQLVSLRNQQDDQKRGLADAQVVQAQLKDNAEVAMTALQAKERQARAQINQIESQISAALTAIINARAKGTNLPTAGIGVGQRISRGQIVGHEGSTGYSTGPHVHFEVRVNNSAVNPAPYVANGTLIWPVTNYIVSQGFGYTDYAQGGAYGGSMHTGIDLAAPYGTPVMAPADGTVIMNQWYGGYGNAWAEQLDSGLVVLLGHMTGG